MPIHCIAWDAQTQWKKVQAYLFTDFHSHNPQMLEKWIQALRREKWHPNWHSYICSLHFEDSCFVVQPGKIVNKYFMLLILLSLHRTFSRYPLTCFVSLQCIGMMTDVKMSVEKMNLLKTEFFLMCKGMIHFNANVFHNVNIANIYQVNIHSYVTHL